jgi:hypothetical protein
MPDNSPRRFTIADGMVLVAATAVGSLMTRAYMPGFYRMMGFSSFRSFADPTGLKRSFSWAFGPPSCMVAAWMVAAIPLRLRRPSPGRRGLSRQPGFVACAAAAGSLAAGLLWVWSMRHRPGFQRPDSFEQAWLSTTHWTASAVAGAWLTLLLNRRWRAEPSWIDRFGRLLGLYWIVQFVGEYVVYRWLDKLTALFS